MTDVAAAPELQIEQYRAELTGYCYRMLGSAFEAEDAVQETLVRAWRGFDRFEGRSALRSWLYRIATNVCLDMLQGRAAPRPPDGPQPRRRRRRRAAGSGSPRRRGSSRCPTRASSPTTPIPPSSRSRGRRSASRSSPRSSTCRRASARVLILREVLRWKATEVAELLDTSVASVNSALQRARATISALDIDMDAGGSSPTSTPAAARAARALRRRVRALRHGFARRAPA